MTEAVTTFDRQGGEGTRLLQDFRSTGRYSGNKPGF